MYFEIYTYCVIKANTYIDFCGASKSYDNSSNSNRRPGGGESFSANFVQANLLLSFN